MAFIPAPNAVEVVLRFTWGGQVVALTLSFLGAAPATSITLANLASSVISWWQANLRAQTAPQTVLSHVQATALDSNTAPTVVVPVTSGGAGTSAGATAPNNVTVTTTFLTALRGRSYRGRNYAVGLTTGSINGSTQLLNATGAALLAAYTALPAAVTGAGFQHAIVSRFTNNAPRATAVVTPVNGYQQEMFLDSQRRRLAGRGL